MNALVEPLRTHVPIVIHGDQADAIARLIAGRRAHVRFLDQRWLEVVCAGRVWAVREDGLVREVVDGVEIAS